MHETPFPPAVSGVLVPCIAHACSRSPLNNGGERWVILGVLLRTFSHSRSRGEQLAGVGWRRVSHDVSRVPLRELAGLLAQNCLHTNHVGL